MTHNYNIKVKDHKGVAYFEQYKHAIEHKMKYASTGRVVSYNRGYAVQVKISGPYLNKEGV